MIAQPQYPQKMNVEEYLEWEATQELRHEYIDGEIIAMTGGSLPHNDITLNFYRTLYSHLSPRGCRVNVSDAKVQANNSRYFYPDLVISCDSRDRESRNFIQHPQVIIEMLSSSTGNYDRTKKLQYYRQIASLQEYVLVDSESISVEVYRRGEDKIWFYCAYSQGEEIILSSLDFHGVIELIYEGISFD
jgi:Uma2 family endonuclease